MKTKLRWAKRRDDEPGGIARVRIGRDRYSLQVCYTTEFGFDWSVWKDHIQLRRRFRVRTESEAKRRVERFFSMHLCREARRMLFVADVIQR